MSKDRRKKKYFQGMEHLQQTSYLTNQSPTSAGDSAAQPSIEAGYIKKDLRNVIILVGIIVVLMVGLTIADKKTDKITSFAEKLTSVVIK